MKYKLSIEGEGENINITDPEVIKKIDFNIFQQDKGSSDRSESLYNNLTIEGILNGNSHDEAKALLEWSKKTKKTDVYKTVSIEIYLAEEKIRDYYLKDMFCSSYRETFNEYQEGDDENSTSIGKFILEMKQKKGSIDTIVVE